MSSSSSPSPPTPCKVCHKPDAAKRCGRCKNANYCSAECQKLDWAQGHKGECVAHTASPPGKTAGSPPTASESKRVELNRESSSAAMDVEPLARPAAEQSELDNVLEMADQEEEPPMWQVLAELAAEQSKQGEYEQSFASYTSAMDVASLARRQDAKLFEARSASALLTGRLDVAQSDAERALALDPGSLRARVRLLRALLRRGDFERALAVAGEVLERDATNQAARADVASANLNARRVEAARQAGREERWAEVGALTQMVLNESPGSVAAMELRAEALAAQGLLDEALGVTTRLMREGVAGNGVLNLRARIFFDQERFDQAQKHLAEVLRADPDDAKAARLLKRLRKVMRLKSEGDEGFKAGQHLVAAEAYAACLAEVQPAASAGGNVLLAGFRAKVLTNRAMALAALGRHDEAVQSCDLAVELVPDYVKAYLRRANSLRALGGKDKLERAVMDFEKIEQLQGEPTQESRENIRRAKQELKAAKRKDYYGILDITSAKEAHTQEDVKKAYRRAALKWHPDRHTNSTPEAKAAAEATFKDVQEAFEVLGDAEKRRLYDRGMDLDEIEGRAGGGHHGHSHGSGGHDMDPDDLFRAYFNGGGGRGPRGGGF